MRQHFKGTECPSWFRYTYNIHHVSMYTRFTNTYAIILLVFYDFNNFTSINVCMQMLHGAHVRIKNTYPCNTDDDATRRAQKSKWNYITSSVDFAKCENFYLSYYAENHKRFVKTNRKRGFWTKINIANHKINIIYSYILRMNDIYHEILSPSSTAEFSQEVVNPYYMIKEFNIVQKSQSRY